MISPKLRGAKEGGVKKDKKKNQQAKEKKTVSLQDFQAEGVTGEKNQLITFKIFQFKMYLFSGAHNLYINASTNNIIIYFTFFL